MDEDRRPPREPEPTRPPTDAACSSRARRSVVGAMRGVLAVARSRALVPARAAKVRIDSPVPVRRARTWPAQQPRPAPTTLARACSTTARGTRSTPGCASWATTSMTVRATGPHGEARTATAGRHRSASDPRSIAVSIASPGHSATRPLGRRDRPPPCGTRGDSCFDHQPGDGGRELDHGGPVVPARVRPSAHGQLAGDPLVTGPGEPSRRTSWGGGAIVAFVQVGVSAASSRPRCVPSAAMST